ncbi:MAG: hypothetical protein QM784_01265 [Polyangiaceae bacterium]
MRLGWNQRVSVAILACSLGLGCNSRDEPQAESSGIEGTLQVVISDFEDGTSRTTYRIELDDGTSKELDAKTPIEIPGGVRVRVHGSEEGTGLLHVTQIESIDDSGQALIGQTPRAPYRVLALMVSPGGVRDSRTSAEIRATLFGNTNSSNAYYAEESYGIASLTGDVYDWLDVPAMNGCDYDTLATNARAAAVAAGIDMTKYQQVMHYFPKTSACGWSGLAYIGRPASPGRNSFFNGATGCVFHHELGHNYGMRHARSYTCKVDGIGAALASAANCTFSEYGDRFDSMGSSCFQHSGYRKASEGWFGKCNAVAVNGSGTFDVVPVELPSNATQTLRIKVDPSLCPSDIPTCYYYVEYRQNLGQFDRTSSTQVYSGALIRIAGAADYTGNGSQTSTYLLDMTPATTSWLESCVGFRQELHGCRGDEHHRGRLHAGKGNDSSRTARYQYRNVRLHRRFDRSLWHWWHRRRRGRQRHRWIRHGRQHFRRRRGRQHFRRRRGRQHFRRRRGRQHFRRRRGRQHFRHLRFR